MIVAAEDEAHGPAVDRAIDSLFDPENIPDIVDALGDKGITVEMLRATEAQGIDITLDKLGRTE